MDATNLDSDLEIPWSDVNCLNTNYTWMNKYDISKMDATKDLIVLNKMKYEKYHTVGTVPKPNRKIPHCPNSSKAQ